MIGSMLDEQNVMEGELSGLGDDPALADPAFWNAVWFSDIKKRIENLRIPGRPLHAVRRTPQKYDPNRFKPVGPLKNYADNGLLFGLGEIADLGKTDPHQIVQAIADSFQNVSRAARGEKPPTQFDIRDLALIAVIGFVGYKLWKMNKG